MFTNTKSKKPSQGFTLIEVLVVIGIIAILAAIVIVAINPARQFAQARNSQRTSNVNSILNAIGQNMADNKGLFKCGSETIDGTLKIVTNDTSVDTTSRIDLRSCLVPTYLPEIPVDPSTGTNKCTAIPCSGSEIYNTRYTVTKDNSTGRITVTAPDTDTPPEEKDIAVTR